MSEAEKGNKSPFKDPLAIGIIVGVLGVPFVFLAVGLATGCEKIPSSPYAAAVPHVGGPL